MVLRLIHPWALCGLIALLVPGGSIAQDEGWDYYTDPAQDMTVASVEYGGGVLVAIQCQARQLSVIIGGVPASRGSTRSVLLTRTDGATRQTELFPIEGSSLYRSRGLMDARFLRAGGRTTISSTADDPQPFRMALDLPTQSAGVDNVLTSCGFNRSDDRDALPDVSHLLATFPPPSKCRPFLTSTRWSASS